MVKKIVVFMSLLGFIAAADVMAQDGSLAVQSTAEKDVAVVNEKGKEEIRRVPISSTSVVPGDEVIYTTYYKNIGKEPATNVAVTNPVPEHMIYSNGSAEGEDARIEFSIDKGKSFGVPDELKIRGADGKESPASPSDYTHIKWTISRPLSPGDKGSASFRAKVK